MTPTNKLPTRIISPPCKIMNWTNLLLFVSDLAPWELFLMCAHLFGHAAFIAAHSLSDPITPKIGDEKLLHYASIRSYLCPSSLGTAWLMLMWSVLFFGPKLPAAAPPVIDKGAPSVTQHSSRFCCKETVSYLMCRRSPGTAATLRTPYGWSIHCPIIRPSHGAETSRANTQGQKQITGTLSCSGMVARG